MNSRRGFTLLEVIVALAIMGAILVASLLAFSQHRRQLALADKRIEATMIADRLVSQLSSQRDGIPVGARGIVANKTNWIWQTSLLGTTTLATVQMRVLRFEIVEIGQSPTQLISVDLVKEMDKQ